MTRTMSPPARLAAAHLPAEVADRWTALLRPAVRLTRPDNRRAPMSGPVAGHLGGLPELPPDVPWPVWEGNGPLSFVASVSLAALAGAELDIPLPEDGTLLFFVSYGPGQTGDGVPGLGPDGQQGARVLYVPEGTPVAERGAPEGIEPYHRIRLSAEPELTWPDREELRIEDLLAPADRDDPPEWVETFEDALGDLEPRVRHRIGGHPIPVQDGGPEYDVVREDEDPDDWVLLAQIDSDERAWMNWVHQGTLYWLITRADLAARNFAAARFTWQFL
ncbi:YwqG family protein [Streptomyces sp. NPDC018019]|uniref:YwqG family protein n=1 Tax=Streptomyces sp. NPDC018019 TaxID=3365030 RepID=UPI00378CF9A0